MIRYKNKTDFIQCFLVIPIFCLQCRRAGCATKHSHQEASPVVEFLTSSSTIEQLFHEWVSVLLVLCTNTRTHMHTLVHTGHATYIPANGFTLSQEKGRIEDCLLSNMNVHKAGLKFFFRVGFAGVLSGRKYIHHVC